MNDDAEQFIFHRIAMNGYEEHQFVMEISTPEDTVITPARPRQTCPKCCQIFRTEHSRLWHQFCHVEAYDGFLDKSCLEDLPIFKYHIPCPHSRCDLKFFDFIDAKFHYMTEHQCCQIYCCGERFASWPLVLEHLKTAEKFEPPGMWPPKMGHFVNLQPLFICICCNKLWASRPEFNAHLQGKEHKCPDPVCKYFFADNERSIRHFFENHYKHLILDARHILLNYSHFLRYEEKQEERCNGGFHCSSCHRRFHKHKTLQKHLDASDCMQTNRRYFTPIVPCKCNHLFVYCYHQRDILLRNIPIFREALEHIEREAPHNDMPDDVCKIYKSILLVLSDVNDRLIKEKYNNYHRTSSQKHSTFTHRQVAKILLGFVDYCVEIM